MVPVNEFIFRKISKGFVVMLALLLVTPIYISTGKNNDVERISISLNFGKPLIENGLVKMENVSFRLHVPNYPVLPFFTKTFVFYSAGDISVKFKVFNKKTLYITEKLRICPISEGILGSYSHYGKEEWFGYRMGRGLYRGKDAIFLTIFIHPVRYLSGKLIYIEKAQVTISYSSHKDSTEGIGILRNESMLIITPKDFEEAAIYLANHKNNLEKVHVVNLTTIYSQSKGRDRPEKIKYYIKDAIEKWGIKYVLLMGSKDYVPARKVKTSLLSSPFLSDLYYADIYDSKGRFSSWDANNNGIYGELWFDEPDLIPDVYIGRFLCENVKEAWIVVKKTICYERMQNKPWFKRIIICAGDTFGLPKDPSFLLFYEGEYMGDLIAKTAEKHDFTVTKIYASAIWKILGSGGSTADTLPLTTNNINHAINEGAGFILFDGHGSPTSWATHPPMIIPLITDLIWLPFPFGYTVNNARRLNNEKKLPVAVFASCRTGDFDTTNNPLAWAFVEHENGGSVASFAFTSSPLSNAGNLYLDCSVGIITKSTFSLYLEKGIERTGEIWGESVSKAIRSAKFSYEYPTPMQWELFGDPSLVIG